MKVVMTNESFSAQGIKLLLKVEEFIRALPQISFDTDH
jgi:hypothetical protein